MFDHSARIKTFIGKALIVKKGYSRLLRPALPNVPHPCGNLVNIYNAAYEPVKLALWALVRKVITLHIDLIENNYTYINLLCSNFPDEALNGSNIYFNWYNFRGEIVDTTFTTARGHDTKPVLAFSKKLYANKGCISKDLPANLKDKDVDLTTIVRRKITVVCVGGGNHITKKIDY